MGPLVSFFGLNPLNLGCEIIHIHIAPCQYFFSIVEYLGILFEYFGVMVKCLSNLVLQFSRFEYVVLQHHRWVVRSRVSFLSTKIDPCRKLRYPLWVSSCVHFEMWVSSLSTPVSRRVLSTQLRVKLTLEASCSYRPQYYPAPPWGRSATSHNTSVSPLCVNLMRAVTTWFVAS